MVQDHAYMSPEALGWETGAVKDARVDIYALGVTLLELLDGTQPISLASQQNEIIETTRPKGFRNNRLTQLAAGNNIESHCQDTRATLSEHERL
jgi:serine/threonine protein kinase